MDPLAGKVIYFRWDRPGKGLSDISSHTIAGDTAVIADLITSTMPGYYGLETCVGDEGAGSWDEITGKVQCTIAGALVVTGIEGLGHSGTWLLAGKTDIGVVQLDGLVPAGAISVAGPLGVFPEGGSNMVLATGIVAMGDSRYYTRHKFPSNVTDAQIIAFFTATAALSEAKLISVMKSIMFDETSIPEGDSNPEYRAKLLCTYPGDRAVVIELPAVATPSPDFQGWFNSNKAALINEYGDEPLAIVQHDVRQERKARGR